MQGSARAPPVPPPRPHLREPKRELDKRHDAEAARRVFVGHREGDAVDGRWGEAGRVERVEAQREAARVVKDVQRGPE